MLRDSIRSDVFSAFIQRIRIVQNHSIFDFIQSSHRSHYDTHNTIHLPIQSISLCYVQIEQVQKHSHVRMVLRMKPSDRRQHRRHVERRLHIRFDPFGEFSRTLFRLQCDDYMKRSAGIYRYSALKTRERVAWIVEDTSPLCFRGSRRCKARERTSKRTHR